MADDGRQGLDAGLASVPNVRGRAGTRVDVLSRLRQARQREQYHHQAVPCGRGQRHRRPRHGDVSEQVVVVAREASDRWSGALKLTQRDDQYVHPAHERQAGMIGDCRVGRSASLLAAAAEIYELRRLG
jgi:hypothetical protein